MTRLLPSVLDLRDLPAPELGAACLDGEVYRVGTSYAPVDEVEQPVHRARAVALGVHGRLIAEQATAAWVWGGARAMPARLQFCAAIGARVNRAVSPWSTVREVVIEAWEVASFGGVPVTTPLRTCVDLARFSRDFDEREARMVLELLRIGRLGIGDCVDDINRRRNLPNKRQALQRLLAADRLTAAQ